jgi:hypothetical protein
MTKITFDIAAHADHDEEADWYAEDLHSTQSEIPQDLAEKFYDSNPLYEVIFDVEYDTETKEFEVVSAYTRSWKFTKS